MSKDKKSFIYWSIIVVVLMGILYISTKHIQPTTLIKSGGVWALLGILFAETGLLVGFFLPGDTLIFAAGFIASTNGKSLNIVYAVIAMLIGAILGNTVGYEIGKRGFHKLFVKKDSVMFRPEYLEEAQKFYVKNGGKAVLLARFIPILRTFAPLVAGAANMDRKKFAKYNVIGALLWVGIATLVGWWAGRVLGKFFDVDKYLIPGIILATLASFASSFIHLHATKKKNLKK